jgi:peptide/nickel transport system permease protein
LRLARYVVKRLLLLVPVLFGISIVTFLLLRVVPGDPLRTLLPQTATEADLERIRARFGLNHSLLDQYWIYLKDLLRGDFGRSFQTGVPVTHEMAQRLGPTIELVTIALLVALVIGMSLGLLSALRAGRPSDHLVRVGSLGATAVPEFWLGLLLILIFYYELGLVAAPVGRYSPEVSFPAVTRIDLIDAAIAGNAAALHSIVSHLFLPVAALAAVTSAPILRTVRAAALAALNSESYRCGEAHGLPRAVLVRHYVVRSSLSGVPTLAALIYGNLLGGAVLIEFIFGWQGFGQWALQGLQTRDYPVVQTFVLVSATVYVIVFLIADVVHAILDPRVKL